MTSILRRRQTSTGVRMRAAAAPEAAAARHAPRSRLLALVSFVVLLMLLLLGFAVATLSSAYVASAAVTAGAAADRALATELLADLGPLAATEPVNAEDRSSVRRVLRRAVEDVGLLGVALVGPDGSRWAAVGPVQAGSAPSAGHDADEPVATLIEGGDRPLLAEWFPIRLDGSTVAALSVVRDGTAAQATAAAAQREVGVATALGGGAVLVVVFLVVRAAQRRLDDQTRQLIEAERRDTLTGLLTHGAAVNELAGAIEANDGAVAVALIDIDNFRQLNEVHGHVMGDTALRRVASALTAGAPATTVTGRSGPDEFLVIAPCSDASAVAGWLGTVAGSLIETGVDTDAGDRLPLSVSAGICVAPLHGRGAMELLSAAALTLGEAKGGGGGEILVGRLSYSDILEEHRATFTILDGLVNAVDTRDRYTRRHSDDVARYALFLAQQLGLDDAFKGALHHAAVLHDVGKIAVPDSILRKPAALTDAEMEVMRQHVVLGGALVRDLAAAELVVEGVRHHHERWDGSGYPGGLAGDAIPLIARIIAVADAYSAMTTTRPYRRALTRGAALERLTLAAGTQLEPRLVDVFVLAMESQATPPEPSDVRAPTLWLAEGSAA